MVMWCGSGNLVPSLIVVLIAVDPQAYCFKLGTNAYISVSITDNETTLEQLLEKALVRWKERQERLYHCKVYECRDPSTATIDDLETLTAEDLKDNPKWTRIVHFGAFAEAKPMERPYVVVVVVPEEQGENCVSMHAIMLAVIGRLPVNVDAIQ